MPDSISSKGKTPSQNTTQSIHALHHASYNRHTNTHNQLKSNTIHQHNSEIQKIKSTIFQVLHEISWMIKSATIV